MGNGLTTNDGDIIRANQEADMASAPARHAGPVLDGRGRRGRARVPGETPAEVPADNRDPGVEVPTPDGDTMPAPGRARPRHAPAPSPRPRRRPPRCRRWGWARAGAAPRSPLSSDEIASNERGNGSLGTRDGAGDGRPAAPHRRRTRWPAPRRRRTDRGLASIPRRLSSLARLEPLPQMVEQRAHAGRHVAARWG